MRRPFFAKHMKTTPMVALCVGILASGCSKSQTSDSARLQKPDSVVLLGKWSGHEVGAETQGSPSVTFEGTKLEFHGANTQEWYKATFTLREDTTPKQLEAVVTECPAPQYVGKTAHAIYKIENGKLTLTGNEPGNPAVPESFNAPGARQIVFNLKQ
jgi:uncharacterized protein (TIGR03067 family)